MRFDLTNGCSWISWLLCIASNITKLWVWIFSLPKTIAFIWDTRLEPKLTRVLTSLWVLFFTEAFLWYRIMIYWVVANFLFSYNHVIGFCKEKCCAMLCQWSASSQQIWLVELETGNRKFRIGNYVSMPTLFIHTQFTPNGEFSVICSNNCMGHSLPDGCRLAHVQITDIENCRQFCFAT